MLAATLAASLWTVNHATPDPRVEIRVDCHDAAACALASEYALDIWSEDQGPDLPLDLIVHKSTLDILTDVHVPFEIESNDIDADARAEHMRITHAGSSDFFADYRDYDTIIKRMKELAALDPANVAMEMIGPSFEGRPIWALKIGHGPMKILVNGTQHAREWIGTMVNMSIADRMVRDAATDPRVRDFVAGSTLWIVPVMNPDGYQYTWGTDRFWRKNRRGGYGVDLNRNWSVAWGGAGTSNSKRSDIYRGEYAFSEPETQAMRNLAKREHFALHVDFHAFSQLILYPWGWSAKPTDDHAKYAGIGDKVASAMYAQHGVNYKLMQSVELYPAAGTMTDWMYGEGGALSYTIELRPKNGFRNGFVLPPSQIKPTSDEAFAALLALRASLD